MDYYIFHIKSLQLISRIYLSKKSLSSFFFLFKNKKSPYFPFDFDFYFLKYLIQSEWALERARGEAAKKWI